MNVLQGFPKIGSGPQVDHETLSGSQISHHFQNINKNKRLLICCNNFVGSGVGYKNIGTNNWIQLITVITPVITGTSQLSNISDLKIRIKTLMDDKTVFFAQIPFFSICLDQLIL